MVNSIKTWYITQLTTSFDGTASSIMAAMDERPIGLSEEREMQIRSPLGIETIYLIITLFLLQ
jgi:hypothetical protein